MSVTFLEKLHLLNCLSILFHPFNSIVTHFFPISVPFQGEGEGEVPSDQSLKEFEGATLRYASINLKYAPRELFLVISNLADVVI